MCHVCSAVNWYRGQVLAGSLPRIKFKIAKAVRIHESNAVEAAMAKIIVVVVNEGYLSTCGSDQVHLLLAQRCFDVARYPSE